MLDWDVHQSAKDVGRCYSFLTPAPAVGGDVADDDDEHWFVAAQNFDAQTRKHDIISDIMDNKEATTPSAQGEWMVLGRRTPGPGLGPAVRDHRDRHDRWQLAEPVVPHISV